MTRLHPTLASLCLAVLDGERDVHVLLADVFEELGSARAEAFRACLSPLTLNGCKFMHQLKDPFDVVLHALPEEMCWRLMCTIAEHVLPLWGQAFPGNDLPRRALQARLAWLERDFQ